MRAILTILLCVVMLLGWGVLFGAFQMQRVQQQAELEPHTIALQELLQSRPANAHVALTDVSAGAPVIETQGEQWRSVWLPLYPAGTPATGAPPAFLKLGQVADQAALDELVKRQPIPAVICARMPGLTPWDVHLPARLSKEYPGQALAKTIVLAEPAVRLLGWTFGPDTAFAGTTRIAAWAIGGALTLIGLIGLLWLGRDNTAPGTATAGAESSLKNETPISTHAFNKYDFASRGVKIGLFCGVLIAFCLVLAAAGLSLLRTKPDAAYTIVGVSSGLILINAFLLWSHFAYGVNGVAAIEVCPSGLRWLRKSDAPVETATWGEIRSVELNHVSPYPWRHVLTIALRSGGVLQLAAFSLTDYARFAKLVSDGHKQRSATSISVDACLPAGGTAGLSTSRYLK